MVESCDAIVMAGGRISGMYARAAGTTIKALVPVCGVPVVRRVVEALRTVTEEWRAALLTGDGCGWQAEAEDGATAAERFFGAKPRPVFEYLLERMPELPRPARKRSSVPEAAPARAEDWPNP